MIKGNELNIYDLEYHKIEKLKQDILITRVPGGWVYHFFNPAMGFSYSSFVPYNEELK